MGNIQRDIGKSNTSNTRDTGKSNTSNTRDTGKSNTSIRQDTSKLKQWDMEELSTKELNEFRNYLNQELKERTKRR